MHTQNDGNKKLQELIRRWDSERELFLPRHRTCRGQRLCPLGQWTNFL